MQVIRLPRLALTFVSILCTGLGASACFASVEAKLANLKKAHNIPVLAYALFENDEWHVTVLGAPENVQLRWGSITKSVTALLVHRLAEQHLVNLDAPVGTYLTYRTWGNAWRVDHPVTVRQLLELKAGFPDLSAQEFEYNQPIALHEALALDPEHRRTRWPPGLQHIYSNMTVGLTQALIESITTESYAAAAERYVFSRLNMHTATTSASANLPGGFKADGKTPIPYWHMTFPAYGALNASIADLTKLVSAIRADAAILTDPRAGIVNAKGFRFDYASGIYPRVGQGYVWQTHGGDADGYRSRYAFLADHPRAYVANINIDSPRAQRAIEKILQRYLTRDLPAPNRPARFAASSVTLNAVSGRYYPSGARFGLQRWATQRDASIEIRVQADNQLEVVKGQRNTILVPVGSGHFRRENDPVATVALLPITLQGKPVRVMQGVLGQYIHIDDCNRYLASFFPPCKGPQSLPRADKMTNKEN
jgi:CubicO group peptidase (beta-lactamase class C family)